MNACPLCGRPLTRRARERVAGDGRRYECHEAVDHDGTPHAVTCPAPRRVVPVEQLPPRHTPAA